MELYIAEERITRNKITGRFLKGNVPANKGKKWYEYMSEDAMSNAKKGWANLRKFQPKTRPDNAGRCRVPVVAILHDDRFMVIPYIGKAAELVGGCRENVRRCCKLNASDKRNSDHKYMGVRFYYERDVDVWRQKIK